MSSGRTARVSFYAAAARAQEATRGCLSRSASEILRGGREAAFLFAALQFGR